MTTDPYCALRTSCPPKSQIIKVISDLPSANRMTKLFFTSANRCSAIAMSPDSVDSGSDAGFDAGW